VPKTNCRAFVIGVILTLIFAGEVRAQMAAIACQTVAGAWTGDQGSWLITQAPNGGLMGTFQNGAKNALGNCTQGHFWGISGTMQSDGSYFITETFDTTTQTRPSNCSPTATLSGVVLSHGCNSATGSFNNSLGGSGTYSMAKSCDMPSGEATPIFVGWDVVHGNPTIGSWNTYLLPDTLNFGGRTVYESNGGPASDTCWKSGDPPQFHVVGVTGSPNGWPVAALYVNHGSIWGSDYIGFSTGEVTYYRQRARTPCGAAVTQAMSIDCLVNNTQVNQTYIPAQILSARIEEESQVTSKRSSAPEAVTLYGPPDAKLLIAPTILDLLLHRIRP
jgi:hypothetical protein